MVMQMMRIGDLAVGQNFAQPNSIGYNDMQCEIIDNLKVHRAVDSSTNLESVGMGYRVLWANGKTAIVRPHNLKFQMKRAIDRKVTWHDCEWKPHNSEPKS